MLSFIVKLSYQSTQILNEEELMFLTDSPVLKKYENKKMSKNMKTKKKKRKKKKTHNIYVYDDDDDGNNNNNNNAFDVEAYIEYCKHVIKVKEHEQLIRRNRFARWKHLAYKWYVDKKNILVDKVSGGNRR